MAKAENESSSAFGRGWLVSGAVVLLALALVVFIALRGGANGDAENAISASPSAPQQGGGGPVAAEPSEGEQCEPPQTKRKERGFPVDAPEVQWERHPSGGVVPVSTTHGPAQRDEDYWRCSSQTPIGALLAGMSNVYNFSTGDKASASEGGNREELFKRSQFGSGTEFGTIEGYRILMATATQAEVEYLLSIKGKFGVMRVAMVWDESRQDWVLDSASNDLGASIVDAAPAGFTTWR